MRYRDAAAFRQALEQRLKARAGGDGARLSQDRKRVVFARLLARLVAAAPDRWLLKGGFALDLRLFQRARATKDVDLDWHAAEEELLEAVIDAATHDAGDFFTFAIERSDTRKTGLVAATASASPPPWRDARSRPSHST
jgi:nucleotidyltransferase AbiEii toxin of type IV toxin-antitoxin system